MNFWSGNLSGSLAKAEQIFTPLSQLMLRQKNLVAEIEFTAKNWSAL
jgi:hypothetical protein